MRAVPSAVSPAHCERSTPLTGQFRVGVPLAEVHRGGIREVTVTGHVVVVSRRGVVASAGAPDAITSARSTVKPIQALPFVVRAVDVLGLESEAIAIACASHDGTPAHVAVVRRVLEAAGVDEAALSCGPQLPSAEGAAEALIRADVAPSRVHNNCSGKHAGMLACCAAAGWPITGYAQGDHPMQRAVVAAWREHCGVDLGTIASGVDGCGLPTPGLALSVLATAFGRAARDGGPFARCQQAMAAHPALVGGEGRFDTALLRAAGERLIAKSGAAGVWVAVTHDGELALAVKLSCGRGDLLPPVAIAALQAVDLLPAVLPAALSELAQPPLTNWAGTVVGEVAARVPLVSTRVSR